MKPFRKVLFAALLLASTLAAAAPAAFVEGVQMPAWVDRAGHRQPVVPGMELKPGDRLTTGPGSRLAVRLSEGSTVKLGENGTLHLAELSPTKKIFKMGSGCGMLNGHDLWYHQLIGGCNGVKVTTSGTFNLFPLENACNGIQAIQIPMITTGRMAKPEQGSNQPLKNYYLEYRTKTGLDANITSAGGTAKYVVIKVKYQIAAP